LAHNRAIFHLTVRDPRQTYNSMISLKNSGSTNSGNPGKLLRCGAESPRTTTIYGVIEAQK
jgi:hypothetical protein